MSDQEQHPPSAPPGAGPGAGPPGTGDAAPPQPPPAAAPLPWENRAQVGFLPGLGQSVRLFMTRPREAFDRARRKGDYGSPLLWLVIVGVLMGLVSWILSMMLIGPMMTLMPPEVRDEVGPLVTSALVGGGVFNLFYYPVGAVVGAFIWALIAHLCLLLVAGGSRSDAGFEGTFRVGAYGQIAQIANAIPIVGGLIALVWSLVLLVIGMSSLHRISNGQAVLVILIPAVLLCACIATAVAGFMGLMGAYS